MLPENGSKKSTGQSNKPRQEQSADNRPSDFLSCRQIRIKTPRQRRWKGSVKRWPKPLEQSRQPHCAQQRRAASDGISQRVSIIVSLHARPLMQSLLAKRPRAKIPPQPEQQHQSAEIEP